MLPTRAYSDLLPPFSAGTRAEPSPADARPTLIVAVAASEVDRFPTGAFARFAARNTGDALRLIERWRPRVVAVDWDVEDFDGKQICAAARQTAGTGVLVTMNGPEHAPAALKAGCHALLLKPLTVNLVAARLGRLVRELPTAAVASRLAEKLGQFGTNRTWPDVACPKCSQAGAVGFEYSSHRRTWYACMGCEAVWLGRRQE
jgi:CheY-like chemotaxis protein